MSNPKPSPPPFPTAQLQLKPSIPKEKKKKNPRDFKPTSPVTETKSASKSASEQQKSYSQTRMSIVHPPCQQVRAANVSEPSSSTIRTLPHGSPKAWQLRNEAFIFLIKFGRLYRPKQLAISNLNNPKVSNERGLH